MMSLTTQTHDEGLQTLTKNNCSGPFMLVMDKCNEGVEWDHLAVAEMVQRTAGQTVEAYTDKAGSRYVFVVSDVDDAEKLKLVTDLGSGFKVRVTAHPTLNKTRCVISSKDLLGVSDAVLKRIFTPQGVSEVHRIAKGKGDTKVYTSSVVLTCEGTEFPETVKFGLLRIRTRPFYAFPLQCYNCYDYGHGKQACKSKTRCRVCSGTHPITKKCKAKAFCFHCKGNHQPVNRKCPAYVKEAEILRLRANLGVPYKDAKKVFNKEKGGTTYATIAARPVQEESRRDPPAPVPPKAGKPKRKRKKAKKSVPKGKESDGARTSKVVLANSSKRAKTATPGCSCGAAAVANSVEVMVTPSVVGVVPTPVVGTDPLPNAGPPAIDEEKQLLKTQVEELTKQNAIITEELKTLKKRITQFEKNERKLVRQLTEATAAMDQESSEEDIFEPKQPLKRRTVVLDDDAIKDTTDAKSGRRGKSTKAALPSSSALDRVNDAATSKDQ